MLTGPQLQVNDIIVDALTRIRINTQQRPLSGNDIEYGLKLMNQIFAEMNNSPTMLPFYYNLSFPIDSSKKKYYIGQGPLADYETPYPVDVAMINLLQGNLRWTVQIISDYEALSQIKTVNVRTLPILAQVYNENDDEGNTYTVIDFYNLPDRAYTCVLRSKQRITPQNINDLVVVLPWDYGHWLTLELARRLVPKYGRDDLWTSQLQQQYKEAKEGVLSRVEEDFEVQTQSALTNQAVGWFAWNLGIF